MPGRTYEKNIEETERCLASAILEQPDIVLLPECFALAGLSPEGHLEHAEPIPGPSAEMCARYAREGNAYVICPIYEREGEHVYNTAVVLGRDGEPVGKYRKLHPTIPELDSGVTPGREMGVLDLDFGKIGLMICFDLYYGIARACFS